jgi:hypothetical protein
MDKFKVRVILSSIITILGIIYLSSVLMGGISKDRLGQTEVIIFTTILLLNSEIVERLAKLQFGKEGMTVELEEKVEHVQKKQDEQQAEIEAIVAFLVKRAMTPTDYKLLRELASDYPLEFDKEKSPQPGLVCLCELGLIERASGEPLKKGDIDLLPSPTRNIKSHIRVSNRGRQCLLLVKKHGMESSEQN